MTRQQNIAAAFALGCFVVSGCEGNNHAASAAPVQPRPAPSAAASTAAGAPSTEAGASAPFGALPNDELWATATDVAVIGAPPGCDAKRAGDWMRVDCRGKNARGAQPTSVTVVGKSTAVTKVATYATTRDGLRLLFVAPPGTRLEAIFALADGKWRLLVARPATGTTALRAAFSPLPAPTGDRFDPFAAPRTRVGRDAGAASDFPGY